MKIKSIVSLAVMGCMLASAAAFAEEEKTLVDVSGKIFMDYSYLMESKDKTLNTKTKNQDSFNLTRAYVNFDKKIDDAWSAKVTLDAGNIDQGVKDSKNNDVNDSYGKAVTTKSSAVYVKNAYGQYKNSVGPAEFKVQAGLVGTPVIELLDSFNGSRWIYQNYVDKSKDIIGNDLDASSADTGIKAEIKLMKMATLTGMYSNSDGYKVKTSEDADKTTKSYYGTLNINPIEALNVFGFYHNRDIAVASGLAGDAGKKKNNEVTYYGAGIAWKDKSFKLGATYTIEDGNKKNVKENASVLELWGNINLNEFVGAPVLVIGRYAQGKYENKAASKVKYEGSAIWGGLGYQFSKNVQVAAMYKTDALTKKTGSVKNNDVESSTMYVKTEIVF